MAIHPPDKLEWSWEESVALYGILAYSQDSMDSFPSQYIIEWARSHYEEATTSHLWADNSAPATVLLAMGKEQLPNDLVRIVERVRKYSLSSSTPRTQSGGISHLGELLNGWVPPWLWVDSLFMHGVFFNHDFRNGDLSAGEEAVKLGLAMKDALQHSEYGLFKHSSLSLFSLLYLTLPVENFFWARGNSWASWFFADHICARKELGVKNWEGKDEFYSTWRKLSSSLLKYRDKGGLWRTDLTGEYSEGNYFETSASFLILASFCRAWSCGLIQEEDKVIQESELESLLEKVIRWESGHPIIHSTSIGTVPGFRSSYLSVPLDENVGHGVGAVLLAISQCKKERL